VSKSFFLPNSSSFLLYLCCCRSSEDCAATRFHTGPLNTLTPKRLLLPSPNVKQDSAHAKSRLFHFVFTLSEFIRMPALPACRVPCPAAPPNVLVLLVCSHLGQRFYHPRETLDFRRDNDLGSLSVRGFRERLQTLQLDNR